MFKELIAITLCYSDFVDYNWFMVHYNLMAL